MMVLIGRRERVEDVVQHGCVRLLALGQWMLAVHLDSGVADESGAPVPRRLRGRGQGGVAARREAG